MTVLATYNKTHEANVMAKKSDAELIEMRRTALEAAGWTCSTTSHIREVVGEAGAEQVFTVVLKKENLIAECSGNLSEKEQAWGRAYMSAKQLCSDGLGKQADA